MSPVCSSTMWEGLSASFLHAFAAPVPRHGSFSPVHLAEPGLHTKPPGAWPCGESQPPLSLFQTNPRPHVGSPSHTNTPQPTSAFLVLVLLYVSSSPRSNSRSNHSALRWLLLVTHVTDRERKLGVRPEHHARPAGRGCSRLALSRTLSRGAAIVLDVRGALVLATLPPTAAAPVSSVTCH